MGDTAASGGYYVAAPGDTIFASPSVVTGSIGIYAFKLDVAGLVAKLGVTTETTAAAPGPTCTRCTAPGARASGGDGRPHGRHYQQFLRTVADGPQEQGIAEERADELGRGQVYTGAQAQAWGWWIGWAAWPTPSTRRPAAAGCPSAPAACPRW